MKNIEKLIPIALEVLEDTNLNIKTSDGKIDKTYNGYISSFGASIISSGLLPTFIFYSKKANNNNDADRSKIITAIEMMLKNSNLSYFNTENNNILKIVLKFNSDKQLKKKIQDCAIALKLAIRTYPTSEKQ